jgi:hypothetical protein
MITGIEHTAIAALPPQNVFFAGAPMESKGNRVVFFTDSEGNCLPLLYRPAPLA